MNVFVLFQVQDSRGLPIANALIDANVWKGKTNCAGQFWAWLGTGKYPQSHISANGYKTEVRDWDFESQPDSPVLIGLDSVFPNPPSRSQIIHISDNFCNLRDNDDWPIDEGFIDDLITSNPEKAQDWITRAKNAKGTHYDLAISGNYNENLGWINQYPIPGHDWTHDLSGFARVLDYVIMQGFIPHIHLAGDGQTPSSGGYSDPNGWTYGWKWSMDNLPRIIGEDLKKYIKYCLWCSGYDGCFPDWSRQQMIDWMKMMKSIDPDIQISTEFAGPGSVSYSHMGNGSSDWTPDTLGMLDAFLIELQNIPPNSEGVQQTAARLLGPKKKNIEPKNDGPYYLAGLDKDIGICLYESNAFQSIRKQIMPADAVKVSQFCANFGFSDFGNGLP